jgi:hypothetical protein
MNQKQISLRQDRQLSLRKGNEKAIIAGKPQVKSKTGKVEGNDQVDVVFVLIQPVVDDKISGLIQTCVQFGDEASKLKLDPQFALISFGDISVVGEETE